MAGGPFAAGAGSGRRCRRILSIDRERLIRGALWRVPVYGRRLVTARGERHQEAVIRRSLTTELPNFAPGGRLTPGFGQGLSERVVEYAWLHARAPRGLTLDAGSALNHGYVLDHLLGGLDGLHVVTLAPESHAYTDRGVSYLFADLRDLPIRDATYDTIVSISTLEHVGLDNARFGDAGARRGDPQAEAKAAVRELARVAKPGARVFLTVPFGVPEAGSGWVRQFDRRSLDDLVAELSPSSAQTTVYWDRGDGWQVADPEAAQAARFREYMAAAVACVDVRL